MFHNAFSLWNHELPSHLLATKHLIFLGQCYTWIWFRHWKLWAIINILDIHSDTFVWPSFPGQKMLSCTVLFPTCLQKFTKIKGSPLIQVTKASIVMKSFFFFFLLYECGMVLLIIVFNLVQFPNCTVILNFHKLSFSFHSQYDSSIM